MQVLRLHASRKFSFTNNANQESKFRARKTFLDTKLSNGCRIKSLAVHSLSR